MKIIRILHRWAGGIIGVLLALLGITGSLLVWKHAWIRATVPNADAVLDQSKMASVKALNQLSATFSETPRYIVFPDNDMSVYLVKAKGKAGFYVDQSGQIVESWSSIWDRLELWLFDLHHYFLLGSEGRAIVGYTGLVGLLFVVTGIILWWRTRQQFKLRLLPDRMIRPAIIKHHRDSGVIATPLLALVMLTGVMMALRPVAYFLLSPLSSEQEIKAATKPPVFEKTETLTTIADVNWQKVIETAEATFPTGKIRIAIMPSVRNPMLTLRVKLPSEWLPNGRTMLWYNPATAELIEARSAETYPLGAKILNTAYPLHAGRVGGYAYKIALTLVGLVLTMLGSFAVWSFWHYELKPKK